MVDRFVIYDEGFSGGNLNCPAFKEMMEAAKERKFQAIIVYRLDRVIRNISDFAGLDVHCVCFLPVGVETIAKNIRDNMQELAKTGRWTGGVMPTGCESEEVKKHHH